jgi:hypothetical protein
MKGEGLKIPSQPAIQHQNSWWTFYSTSWKDFSSIFFCCCLSWTYEKKFLAEKAVEIIRWFFIVFQWIPSSRILISKRRVEDQKYCSRVVKKAIELNELLLTLFVVGLKDERFGRDWFEITWGWREGCCGLRVDESCFKVEKVIVVGRSLRGLWCV